MTLSRHQRLVLAWLVLALVAGTLVWLLAPVLVPFVAAAVAAYALHPLVSQLVRLKVPRTLAVALVEAAAILVLTALLLLVLPILGKELPQLRAQLPQLANALNTHLSPLLRQMGVDFAFDVDSIKAFAVQHLSDNWQDWAGTALTSARIGGSVLIALIGNLVLLPVVLFYLLYGWPQLLERAWALVPPRLRHTVGGFIDECDAMLGQYLRGQLLVMGLLAIYYAVALTIAGFDLALPIGVFTGLAIFIPYLGFGFGLVLALMAGALQFSSGYGVLAVAGVYGLGQLLEGFVLTPRLVGERIGLSPLMVIFALLAFGHLLGFVGVLIALPLSALGVVAARHVKKLYLASAMFKG